MSCPVQTAIAELYETGRYSGCGDEQAQFPAPDMLFYITRRKLEYTRACAENNGGGTGTTHTPVSIITDGVETNDALERMFADYKGISSMELFQKLLSPICAKTASRFLETVDMIIIAEAICSGELARDFPDGMSLPEISFDPDVLCNEGNPSQLINEVNKMITYACKLRVSDLRCSIEQIEIPKLQLREFNLTGDYAQMHAGDIEVAEYAFEVEKLHTAAVHAMAAISEHLQKITHLAK